MNELISGGNLVSFILYQMELGYALEVNGYVIIWMSGSLADKSICSQSIHQPRGSVVGHDFAVNMLPMYFSLIVTVLYFLLLYLFLLTLHVLLL